MRGNVHGRLGRLEASAKGGVPCPGCGLSSGERRPISVAYEDSPFGGDAELCPRCGRPPSVLLRVVYEPETAGGGRDA
jgi:hypothetical protein